MFYAASEDSASVLALATDPSNDILVSGDSAGRISVWDITSYCISRAESIIAQVWSTTQRMSSTDDSPEGSPPCVIKWHAHGGAVVSLEVVSRDEKLFLVSSSVDCTARLWTLDGKYVGMFGQFLYLYGLDREVENKAEKRVEEMGARVSKEHGLERKTENRVKQMGARVSKEHGLERKTENRVKQMGARVSKEHGLERKTENRVEQMGASVSKEYEIVTG
ncbi:predicted protein [Nematostella vectensis]|uniref:Uncharacterized protein n=1 Tax=Nematostella vectensis TaxID=45351 RepID=A7T710_NEMVE|nr:predicted protein [Nematostella vectensis]|eukprot:XP_001620344.1 hypothetical protein NEMVEDRAFT_v1g223210 [Nematostella vectensis]